MQDLERELHHLKFLNSNMIRELEAADLYDKIRGRGTGQARAFFAMSVMKTYLGDKMMILLEVILDMCIVMFHRLYQKIKKRLLG